MQNADQPAFIEHQYAFAAHLRDPDKNPAPTGIEDRRMEIYRELFYNNVEGFLTSSFPVLRTLIKDDDWHAMARDFYAKHHCHSPLFLEIPHEFLSYLKDERETLPSDLPFMQELAHYEWVELALSIAESEDPIEETNVDGDLLDQCPQLTSLAWPLSYQYPVHQISPDFQPESPPENPTYILVYRDLDDEVSFIEFNAVSARLFSILQENKNMSGRGALEQIATELQHPDTAVVVNGGLEILQEWRKLGIVYGTI